ncbi:MAG: peptidyl-prolyl cis-trans isomerase [Lachnospiraceae bacterium]|nr:peptidyl-prolyl cis-trans isomerase [Lachnospiraceae bacterium]
MSKNENITEAPVKEEKVVTRYDRKMQKRREQEAKDLKEKKINRIVGIVVLAVIVCFIASFPIRSFIALNETFVEVDGEKVTKFEFDYYYNMSLSTYYNQYGMYMSMMGVDLTGDLSTQYYTEYLTWHDFFQQMAVQTIQQNKALMKEAKAEGFTFDTSDKWEDYKAMLKDQAAEAAVPLNSYVKYSFGSYATMGRIKNIVKDTLYISAYTEKLMEENMPSDEEVVAYYEENKDNYDSVDFRLVQVDAELTAEEPTEAEIEAAMKEAKKKAEEALKTVAKDGELKENYTKSYANSNYSDWLFDASRKAGDTTMVEDTTNHRYYVVAFEKRYLKEEPTANARVIVTEEGDGQAILDEWTKGAATEESFIELFKKYSDDLYSTEDGLYEGITASVLDEEMAVWVFAEERKDGDTTAIVMEDAADYVIYFKEFGDFEWELNIQNTLVSTTMSEYIRGLMESMEVNDPKGNLYYLEVEADLTEQEGTDSTQTAETSATAEK